MIVVTGGAGFVGCNLIKGLNNLHRTDILVVDCLKNGFKYMNLLNLSIADYLDKDCFIKYLSSGLSNADVENIDAIFHEGACSSTMEWDGQYIMNNNYQYSKELLHFCVENRIPFIYASSGAVYGKSTNMSSDNSVQYERPVNIYGYSKYLFDRYVQSRFTSVDSQICGLRYFNIYGPGEIHKGKMSSIILNIYKQIVNGDDPTLFIGSKEFKRDFIYVEDVVDVNLWMWRNNISGIFDCGTGQANSIESVANIVLKFFNKSTLKYVNFPKELYNHYQIFTQANISQLRKVGYTTPFIDVREGINKYLQWIRYYDQYIYTGTNK